MNWLRRVFGKSVTGISLIPSFVSKYGWSLTERFFKLVSEGYRKNAVVYTCIRALAQGIAEAPMRIYNQGSDKDLPNHPVRILLERPNQYMSEYEFWELTVTYLSVGGRAPWFKVRGNDGSTVQLLPLRPDRIENVYGEPGTSDPLVKGYKYQLDTTTMFIPAADVLMFNYPDPGSDDGGLTGGMGPLQVLAREVDTDTEATSFVYNVLRNNAVLGAVISTEAVLNKDDAERLKENFKAKYSGMNRGEPAILDSNAKVTPMAFSLSELEFPDLRAVSESRISAAFGVPAIVAGLKVGLDRSTFSNMQEARRYMAETTLASLWRRLSDQINLDLGDEHLGVVGKGQYAKFDTSQVSSLQQARTERLETIEAGFEHGALLLDEYRVALGFDPLENGKGQVFLRPALVTEVRLEDAGAPPKPVVAPPPAPPNEPQPGGDPAAPPPADDDPAKPGPAPAKPKSLVPAAKATQPDPRALERRQNQRVGEIAATYAPQLTAEFAAQGRRVVGRLMRQKDAKDHGDSLITPEDEGKVRDLVSKLHGAVVAAGVQDAASTLGLSDYPAASRVSQDVLAKLATRIVGINETTAADVRKVVGDGIEGGSSLADIASGLHGLYAETYAGRSMTIARTETTDGYNLSSVATYRDNGIDQVLVYDGDYDEECAEADGETWSLDDADANPSAHPNCVRGFSPIIPDSGAETAGLRLVS